jgi:glycosyltransferase involved in cell wall biosynthesis
MNILVLAPHPFFQPRGTPIAVREVLEFLSSEGHTVDLLTYHEGTDVEIPGCTIHRIRPIPGVRGIRPGFSIKKVLCDAVMFVQSLGMARRKRYHLVHAVEESVFMANVIRLVYGIPFVYDMDSSLTDQVIEKHARLAALRPGMRAVESNAVRRSVGVLAVCPALENRAREYDADQLVACVEDASLLQPVSDDNENLADSLGAADPLIMYVGNLERYQGMDLLLDSFARAVEDLPRARLVVIGGTVDDIQSYRRRSRQLHIEDRAHFIGPRPLDLLAGYLRQADILVSPRLVGNNTPMKIYSYLDSGVPILATRLPTHTQVLDDSIAALADPTPEAFASAIVRLARDSAWRQSLAHHAALRVQQDFTPAATRGKLRNFYHAVATKLAWEES